MRKTLLPYTSTAIRGDNMKFFSLVTVVMFLTLSAQASNLECEATVNKQTKVFSTPIPGEPDSINHIIDFMIFEAQPVSENLIKMSIGDTAKGWGSAIGTLNPGQTLTYVSSKGVINTLTCYYK